LVHETPASAQRIALLSVRAPVEARSARYKV
jgi:hypothetical protein